MDIVTRINQAKLVLVDLLVLFETFSRNINQPIRWSFIESTQGMIKHLLLRSHFDFDIIELSPNILVMILDHGIVVTTLFASIMNADTMKVVSFFA